MQLRNKYKCKSKENKYTETNEKTNEKTNMKGNTNTTTNLVLEKLMLF